MPEFIQTDFRITDISSFPDRSKTVASERLTLLFSPHGSCCIRKESQLDNTDGYGASDYNPLRLTQQIKDWFNGYSDYKLTPEQAIQQVSEFEQKHPKTLKISYMGDQWAIEKAEPCKYIMVA